MKKITLLISFLVVTLVVSAQTKITFEDNTVNGAAALYGGSVSVISNPVKTGLNTSAYCLDVVNDGYAPIKFSNFTIPTGTSTVYPYVKIKFKIAYKGYNGGTDLDYPQVDVYSSPASPILDATEKLGSITSAWGTHASDSLVWKTAEFTISASLLASVPNGILVLKVAKSKCEYLLDDIELVPSPIYNSNVITVENFENAVVGDAATYQLYKYWSTTATVGSATVAVDPVAGVSKTLKVIPTDYNGVINFNVTLPTGKTLDNYDRLYFDLYFNNSNGLYAQPYIAATTAGNDSVIYKVTSSYPSQGTNAIWNTKDYELVKMPALNSFRIKIGYTSNNSVTYYLDNVKLHLREGTSGFESVSDASPLVIYQSGFSYKMNMTMNKVEVIDVRGRVVLSQNDASEISASHLARGFYIVKATLVNTTYIGKIIK